MRRASSLLKVIEHRRVTAAQVVHDYVQLAFGEEITISIYNEVQMKPASLQVGEFVGKVVTFADESPELISIKFVDGSEIAVDLRPAAYRGPEALQLNRAGQPIVIWN